MISSPSDLAPTVPVSSRGAGEEAFAHMSRDGSQAMVQAVILELSVKISRRVVLLEACSNYPTRCSEDMAAFAWIQRTLEDVEATLIGLSAVKRRLSAAFQGPPPSSVGDPVSEISLGPAAASITAGVGYAGGLAVPPLDAKSI